MSDAPMVVLDETLRLLGCTVCFAYHGCGGKNEYGAAITMPHPQSHRRFLGNGATLPDALSAAREKFDEAHGRKA